MTMQGEIRRLFTPAEDEIIRSDYAAYVPTIEIARKLNRDEGTTRQRILRLGLRRSAAVSKALAWAPPHLVKQLGTTLTAEQFWTSCWAWREEQMRQLEASNEAAKQAAKKELLAKCAEIDQRHDLSRRDKIIAKRMTGMTLEAIGNQHGITRERVRQITDHVYARKIGDDAKYVPSPHAGNGHYVMPFDNNRADFTVRTYNALVNENITTIEQLTDKTPQELLRLPNFGRRSLNEIRERLCGLGLCLRDDDGRNSPYYLTRRYSITNKMRIKDVRRVHLKHKTLDQKIEQMQQERKGLLQEHAELLVDLFNAAPDLVRKEFLRRIQPQWPQKEINHGT